MADFTATFEAGSNGSNVTTGGGEASATAWTGIFNGSATDCTYDNAHVANGTLAAKWIAQRQLQWDGAPAATDHYGRLYLYCTANPSSTLFIVTASNSIIRLLTNGKIGIQDGSAHQVDSTASISLNQWVRIEYHFVHSATVGQLEVKLFNTAESTTPTEVITSPATWNTGTAAASLNYGWVAGGGGSPFWMDSIVGNATSYPGHAPAMCTAGFELGTNGATIGTGDAGDSTAWDSVSIGSGTLTYDTSQAAAGSTKSAKFVTVGNGTNTLTWTTALGGPLTDYYWRIYIYLTAYPTLGSFQVLNMKQSGSNAWRMDLRTSGRLEVYNAPFGATLDFTNAVNLNAWTRVEGHAVHGSGNLEVKLFLDPESDTATETKNFTGTSLQTNATDAVFNVAQTNSTLWYDQIVMGATSYPGPATSSKFGVATIDGAQEAPGANYKVVSKFALAEAGTVSKLSLYMAGSGGVSNVRGFIYADSSGSPGALKAVGSEFSVPDGGAPQWYDSTLSVALTAGDYWLGFFSDSGTVRYYRHSVTNNRKYKAETYSASPSDPYGSVDGTDSLEVTVYATYLPSAYVGAVLADSPNGYWRMNESSGTTALSQVNSGTMNGVFNGPVGPSDPAAYGVAGALTPSGDMDTAITLSGAAGDWMRVADTALVDLGDVFTFEIWLKRASIGTLQYIVAKQTSAQKAAPGTLSLTAANKFSLDAEFTNLYLTTATLTDTASWHHLVITKNGATNKIYLDSVDITPSVTNVTFVDNASDLNIGNFNGGGGTTGFDGSIDEVALYPTALSAARVLAHYNAGIGAELGAGYKRFAGPAQLTASAATLYTCPDGMVARTLHIHASNPSSSAVDVTISVGADAADTRVYGGFSVPADSVIRRYDEYSLAAGETIQAWASSAATVVLTVTGYDKTV